MRGSVKCRGRNNSSYCLRNNKNNNNYNSIHGQIRRVGLYNIIIIYYNIVLCTFMMMIVLPIIIFCIEYSGKFGYVAFRYFYFS